MSIATLVVDDEPIARHAIVRLLCGDPDIELLGECGDGASAVEAIRHQSPELVFLDIQMPVMSGMEVAATIGAFVSGKVSRILEIATTYNAGLWSSVRSVQAEARTVLLNGTRPQVLQAAC